MDANLFLKDAITKAQGTKFKTYSELAKLAGVNQGNLSSFMGGKVRQKITFETAWKILDVLGAFVPWLPQEEQQRSHVEALQKENEALKRENSLLRELVDALKENRALEKSSGDRGAQEIEELSSGSGRRALPPVEERGCAVSKDRQ